MRKLIGLLLMFSAMLCLGQCRADASSSALITEPAPQNDQEGLFAAAAQTDALLAPATNADGSPILADDASSDLPPQLVAVPKQQNFNAGGAHFDLDFRYANRYVYRGVDHNTVATHGNSLNLIFQGQLSFDFGPYPHPFVGLFTNIYDADPISRFEEIRPYVGMTWELRPIELEMGHISYIFPERETFNYPEAYAKVGLDDSLLFNTQQPIFSPYAMAAYDYRNNSGWYVEAGVKHDFVVEELGLVLTPQFNIAWISGLEQQFVFLNPIKDTGFQHLEIGMTAAFSLNNLFNVSNRFGEIDLKGYGFYDEKLSTNITANNVLWGGVGLGFKY